MTYEQIEKKVCSSILPICGENEDGEKVIIESLKTESGRCFLVTTSQNNGWNRKNYYYADGSTEETYER